MRKLIEHIVNRLGKHQNFSLDSKISIIDIIRLSSHLSVWTLRGLIFRWGLGATSGLLMIGRGVRIRYPNYLYVGKNFIIEDYAEIMGLSHNGIRCGDNVTIGAYTTIKPTSYYGKNIGEGLCIGNNSNIGRYGYVGCSGLITIGENVMIGPRVSFFAENHNFAEIDRAMKAQGVTRAPILVENDCWIASGSTILAGVTVGQGSIIAANSVVTKNVAPYSVMAGSPAKLIRSRNEDLS